VFLRQIAPVVERAPTGFGFALCAADRAVSRSLEVAVVGEPTEDETRALLEVAWSDFLPNRVIAAGPEGSAEPPLLRARPARNGAATAYVCEDFTCKEPVTQPDALARQLSSREMG
jgi:uncharacterized protein